MTWVPDSFSLGGDSVGGPLRTLHEKEDAKVGDARDYEFNCSGEQKHRSHWGVGSASSSSFTQSSIPAYRAPGFKRTKGSGEEDV